MRRVRPAHCGSLRLARCRRSSEFPARCLGIASDLHRKAAGDSARPAAWRTRPNVRWGGVGPGRQRSRRPGQRQGPVQRGNDWRGCSSARRAAPSGAERHRGTPLPRHRRRHRHGARLERRRSNQCVQCHTGQAAGNRAHEGSGAPEAFGPQLELDYIERLLKDY